MEQTDRRLLPSYHAVSVFPDSGYLTTWLLVSVSVAALSLSLSVALATQGHLRIDCLANPAHPHCH
jgi:hypothetical protein